ncbi:hypothetical protein NL676_012990 [Syzygium grande]|nr:hypothetical protein NL676_012990 [Syzygium grande]
MARLSNKVAMLFNLFLVLFLLLSVSTAYEPRSSSEVLNDLPKVGLQCYSVYGVKGRESCDDVMQMFNLSSAVFHFFNVNLDCNHLYNGQWLCVNNMTLY